MIRLLLAVIALLLALCVGPSAHAQPEVEELIDEIEGMLGGLGATVDPAALIARELPGVESAAGLTATAPIVGQLITRADAAAHIRGLFDTQLPPARRAPMQIAWHAMGLLPRDQTLEEAVLSLYGSQVGGFYDPARKALFLLDDMPSLVQLPIVRHELVHALQDQRYDLARWLAGAEKDEDAAAALQAVLEGHASDVMSRATLGQLGLADGLEGLDPGLTAELGELFGGEVDTGAITDLLDVGIDGAALDAFIPRATPAALRAQLLFPYVVGTRFVSEYRAAHPEDPSCAALYARPPRTTAEVLAPARWESGTTAPDIDPPGTLMPGWQLTYQSPLGRLLTHILLTNQSDPFAGDPDGARWPSPNRDNNVALTSGWSGDHVAVYQRNPAHPGIGVPDQAIVVWTSRWSHPEEAAEIARVLATRVPAAEIAVRGARLDVVFSAPAENSPDALRAVQQWK